MRIVKVELGDRVFYVLQNEKGVPLAQGRLKLVWCMKTSLEWGDTPLQCSDRLLFWGVV